MTQFGWENGLLFVNSAAYRGRGELEDSGWPIAANGSITEQQLHELLGTTEAVVVGRYAMRERVRDLYRPRGTRLSREAANDIVNGTIMPLAAESRGVPWIKAAAFDRALETRPAVIRSVRIKAGKQGGRPLGE